MRRIPRLAVDRDSVGSNRPQGRRARMRTDKVIISQNSIFVKYFPLFCNVCSQKPLVCTAFSQFDKKILAKCKHTRVKRDAFHAIFLRRAVFWVPLPPRKIGIIYKRRYRLLCNPTVFREEITANS
jgi:hypothetical protein